MMKNKGLEMKQFDKVMVLNNKYINDGVNMGDIGFIIDIFSDSAYDVEFSLPDGTTYALCIINPDDLKKVED